MEMNKRKHLKKIPAFKNPKQEVEFWDTHDSTEYIDWDKAAPLEVSPSFKSPRCPHDKQVLLSRWRNIVIADGFATLNHVRELYCPRGDFTRLAPETQAMVKRAEAALRRVQGSSLKIAA